MSELALFIVGTGVFTMTLMAVLWTGYLVFANRFDADRIETTKAEAHDHIDLPHAERIAQPKSPTAT